MIYQLIQTVGHIHIIHYYAFLIRVKLSSLLTRKVYKNKGQYLALIMSDKASVVLYFVNEAIVKVE